MREFAEAEIIIPEGPFQGRRFRCSRQPYTALWFAEVESGRWNRCVATGPTQSGKTLSCFIIPLLYHLFEIGETVILGLPDMDMGGDKWRQDILPVIERSRYEGLLPRQGGGSRGGRVESIQFRNGATLKFMSGGGKDKSRAGFTSRVLVITETDGLDEPGTTSREADKITQLEARTRAYGDRKRIYMECTVSTEEGRTWTEYQNGTKSRIVLSCPHCQSWVTPEREHFVGWQEAQSQADARVTGAFACPDCGEVWSSEERIAANEGCRLLHDGQTIDEAGQIQGDPPKTDTLGFRWSAVNNLFLTPGDFAADEWRASRSADEENAEREMRQFVWCLPVVPSKLDETAIKVHELAGRVQNLPRGIVPDTATHLTIGVDLGKYLLHWIAVAWSENATGHVVDYGRIEVATVDLGVEKALLVALRELREIASAGWAIGTADGKPKLADQVWIDSGYMSPIVYAFCREAGERYTPSKGYGAGQQHRASYHRPTSRGAITKQIGEEYHLNKLPTEKLLLAEVNADHWKSFVHQRFSTPLGNPGAMTLFHATPHEHLTLARHLTSEVKTEEFVPDKGVVVKWEKRNKHNHWFDALYNACAAGHYCGVRLVEEPPKPKQRVLLAEYQRRARWADAPSARELAEKCRRGEHR